MTRPGGTRNKKACTQVPIFALRGQGVHFSSGWPYELCRQSTSHTCKRFKLEVASGHKYSTQACFPVSKSPSQRQAHRSVLQPAHQTDRIIQLQNSISNCFNLFFFFTEAKKSCQLPKHEDNVFFLQLQNLSSLAKKRRSGSSSVFVLFFADKHVRWIADFLCQDSWCITVIPKIKI